ncbi:MAG: hypothetical protein PHV36_14350 [Elusimicrobiales bacterium]|nr:hypothetical protein [Elusimicrobiales bacterium]
MKCLIYQNKAAVMKDITDRLGRGRTNGEKTRLVKKLGQEADSLLTCADYKDDSQDCKNCRATAVRRKNMMWGILKNMKTGQIIIAGK